MKTHLITGIMVASFLALAPVTKAVPTMSISDGINPVVIITDGSGSDANGASGVVGFNGTIGSWSLVVTTGQTKPALGSASSPQMDLNYVVTSTGAGSLTILWSDTDFTSAGGFFAEIGGTTSGTIAFDTYADTGNTIFGMSTHLTSLSFSTSPFSGTQSAAAVNGTPFSLTERIVINHGSGTRSESGNANLTSVPDGTSTVVLLGTSLVCLGLMATCFKHI